MHKQMITAHDYHNYSVVQRLLLAALCSGRHWKRNGKIRAFSGPLSVILDRPQEDEQINSLRESDGHYASSMAMTATGDSKKPSVCAPHVIGILWR